MAIPSHLSYPLFLVLISILMLIPLISLVNNEFMSIFTTKTVSFFHGKPNHVSNFSLPRAISVNVSECLPVDLPLGALTPSNNCCPPMRFPVKFVDFNDIITFNNISLRVRKPAHLVDEDYITKFEKGIALMKALPYDDPRNFYQQAMVHCAYCLGAYSQQFPFHNLKLDIHRSWFFFPFHRWYLFFFERILGNLIGDPNFALPFWNWDSVEGMQIPSYFLNQNSSLFDNLRNINHMPPHVVDLAYQINFDNPIPTNQQISFNLVTMYKQMVLANTKELFMGSPLRLGDLPHPGPGSIEVIPHNTLHDWMGAIDTPSYEDMGAFYSAARDPIFYSHHSNVDRMWVLWKNLENGRNDYNDPDWLNSEFFFYDENANLVRVKVGDCIDTKKLGYVYQDVDLPWLNHPPTYSSPKSKLVRESKRGKFGNSKPIIEFPLVLDSIVSTAVKRPRKLRSKGEKKEQEEEVLVIEGIEFGSDKFVKFDIHVNDDEENLSGPERIEFVGSFVSVQQGHIEKIKTRFKVGISKLLENLEDEDEGEDAYDDDVVVTLVPNVGRGEVIIGSIMIELMPKN